MPTILLLEDDIQLSATIEQFLSLKGYQVILAYDGLVAQEIIYEKHIDLMLLDVKVPLLDGISLLKELRESGNETPAIMITSLNSVDDVERGFEVGCDDYIRKPFALKELLVRVEAQLKRRYNSHQDRIEITKECIFDTKEMIVIKNGEKVPLKTKELKLLELLLRNQDKLLKYEQIFDVLWDYSEQPSSGALRTYIKELRSIIGKDKIETVKNIGYRFVTK
jgi:DNA-binding response OmpR family regulator